MFYRIRYHYILNISYTETIRHTKRYIHINWVIGYSFFNLRNFPFNLNSSNEGKLGKMLPKRFSQPWQRHE